MVTAVIFPVVPAMLQSGTIGRCRRTSPFPESRLGKPPQSSTPPAIYFPVTAFPAAAEPRYELTVCCPHGWQSFSFL